MYSTGNTIFSFFYILCFKFILINSGSTLWKLNSDQSKIIDGTDIHSKVSLFEASISDEEMLEIIGSTVYNGDTWLKRGTEKSLSNSVILFGENQHSHGRPIVDKPDLNCPLTAGNSEEKSTSNFKQPTKPPSVEETLFECGVPANFTHYDNLMGVHNRYILPNVSNPQSSSVFGYHTHNEVDNEETTLMIDFSDYIKFLVRCIKKTRLQKSQSAPLYNFLGNYWQLKGYSSKSMECFRKGLSISPHNARILLNMARLLFSLQYLDDAIYLTKRSLEMEQMQNGVWIHHFTLGEIFKTYGLYQEATVHLNHSLKLKPDLTVAKIMLQQIRIMQLPDQIHGHTILIIVSLVLLVLGIMLLVHNLDFNVNKERNVFQIAGSTKYFKSFKRIQRCRKPST